PSVSPAPRGKPARQRTSTDRFAHSLAEQAKVARRAAEALLRAPAAPLTPTDLAGPDTSPVTASVDALPDLGIHDVGTEPLRARPGSPPGARGPPLAVVEDIDPPSLDVRFLRGSDWVPVRARALSAKGAYLVTSAPARLGDTVHVSVSCAKRTALVRG